MFGMKKRKVHAQAMDLMREWHSFTDASTRNIAYGFSEKELENVDEQQATLRVLDYNMAVLGVIVYMVAGMGHIDTAQEMIEIFKGIVVQMPEDINPKQYTANDAAYIVNAYYGKARVISESLMDQKKGFDVIVKKLANGVFEWLGFTADEDEIAFVENGFKIIYKETYAKYFGKEPDFVS